MEYRAAWDVALIMLYGVGIVFFGALGTLMLMIAFYLIDEALLQLRIRGVTRRGD